MANLQIPKPQFTHSFFNKNYCIAQSISVSKKFYDINLKHLFGQLDFDGN